MAKRRPFTPEEIARLKADYRTYVDSGRAGDLAHEMGRSKSVLSEKAGSLGLTDPQKAKTIAARAIGDRMRGRPLPWPHSKGFKGKRHSPEAREKMGKASQKYWDGVSDDVREAKGECLAKALAKRGGPPPRPHATWKSGWRRVGDKAIYFRSRWEANYARYLEWLKQRGEILKWAYEPETFWFEKIKRGVRSYRPDFRVWENDGASNLHEVKGWMDARSKTTLKRMAKYYPSETIILIRERDYNSIARQVSSLIEGWEHSERVGRW